MIKDYLEPFCIRPISEKSLKKRMFCVCVCVFQNSAFIHKIVGI